MSKEELVAVELDAETIIAIAAHIKPAIIEHAKQALETNTGDTALASVGIGVVLGLFDALGVMIPSADDGMQQRFIVSAVDRAREIRAADCKGPLH